MKYFRLIDYFNTDSMNNACEYMDSISIAVEIGVVVPKYNFFGIKFGEKYEKEFMYFKGSFIYYSESSFLYMIVGNELKAFHISNVYYAPSRTVLFEKTKKAANYYGKISKGNRDPYYVNLLNNAHQQDLYGHY